MTPENYLGERILNQVVLDQTIAKSIDREVGLNDKMDLVKLHYINCTDGIEGCHICEMVYALMHDYTCFEIMQDIEVE
jgi:hypothetical protein